MKLIVGLGNPGGEYTRTRHNAGFLVVDRLLGKLGSGEPLKARFQSATSELDFSVPGGGREKCVLMKPITYMNRSGQAVGEAVRFFKAEPARDLLVVVDDLYLPVGQLRLRPGGGTGGHNGLDDIQRVLGTDDYPRLRVGVGMQPAGGKPAMMDQADYVLSRFTEEERPLLEPCIAKAAEAAEMFATKGLAAAMNVYNAPDKGEGRAKKAV